MKKNKKVVCLVDDDPDELRRFKEALGARFTIGVGQSVQQSLEDLRWQGAKKPSLFLLDLYHPEGAQLTPEQRKQLHSERRAFLQAQARFRGALAELGQTIQGGFKLIDRLPKGAQFAFFTRKGTLEDALDAHERGALSVIKKPDPPPPKDATGDLDEVYDRAAEEGAERTAADIDRAIQRASWSSRHPLALGYLGGVGTSLLAALLYDVARTLLRTIGAP